eukprot:scaffold14896_cov111-Isochrysis_galbana.AAC.16
MRWLRCWLLVLLIANGAAARASARASRKKNNADKAYLPGPGAGSSGSGLSAAAPPRCALAAHYMYALLDALAGECDKTFYYPLAD